jgi:hypothetical protein
MVTAPVLYHQKLLYYGTPDIQYVKAKVLRVMEGDLYADPVTGYDNFHPPYYHLFLAGFVHLGIDVDTVLLLLSIINVCLVSFFVYLIMGFVFDRQTAFYVVLLVPFIWWQMGPGHIFLATAYFFSVPFYMAGLYLYLKNPSTTRQIFLVSFFWGITFLISPVYLFLIGLTFAYELFFQKGYRRFTALAVSLLAVIIPFYVQVYAIYGSGLAGTKAFSFWRGIPNFDRVTEFIVLYLSPVEKKIVLVSLIQVLIVTVLGIIEIVRQKKIHPLIPIAALAYILTAYHFRYQYAIRIQFFLSLFICAYAVRFMIKAKTRRWIIMMIVLLIAAYGVFDNIVRAERLYGLRAKKYPVYMSAGNKLWRNIGQYIEPDSYVFANAKTYRYFMLPFYPSHALLAYKSGEYFQLNSKIAEKLQADYNELMNSTHILDVERICEKYDIKAAVAINSDMELPVFQIIAEHWNLVYKDNYFKIFRRPDNSGI